MSIPAISTRPRRRTRPGSRRASAASARAVVERSCLLERKPGERAVHRTGVEVAKAEALASAPGDRALAGAGRAVDGDDHAARAEGCASTDHWARFGRSISREEQRSRSTSSKKPGKLTATDSASISTPCCEASPATAPSIAMRWSPRLVTRAPARPRRHAPDRGTRRRRVHVLAQRAQGVGRRLDAIGLLRPQLLGAVQRRCHPGRRRRRARTAAARRSPRNVRRGHVVATSSAERTSRSPAGSPAIRRRL